MAGRGSRLFPQTFTVPKPFFPIAGVSIIERLINDVIKTVDERIEEISFILGDPAFFGGEIVLSLEKLTKKIGVKCVIYRQLSPLGTGHAIMCASPSLKGKAIVVYADMLIKTDFKLDTNADAMIWVKKVKNPNDYGVVRLNAHNEIIELVEKPQTIISDLAVIGVYYFKNIEILKNELQKVLESNMTHDGEYQINDGILSMIKKGGIFKVAEVREWMDCGDKDKVIESNRKTLLFLKEEREKLIADSLVLEEGEIISPCYIGENVVIEKSIIGPYVSVGNNTVIRKSKIKNTIIQEACKIEQVTIEKSIIGRKVCFNGNFSKVNIGDLSILE